MIQRNSNTVKVTPPVTRKGYQKKKWIEYMSGYIFILPNLVLITVFLIYPLVETFRLSFYDADIQGETFIGFQNYITIFSDPIFLNSIKNTFYFVIIVVPVVVIVSFTLAAMMRDLRQSSKVLFRIMFYLPVVSTPVVMTMIWAWIYNTNYGILNYLRTLFGYTPTEIMGTPTSAIIALSVVVATWSIGQPVILYLASMDGIPKDYYEAAEIDGANPFRKFFNITLPLVGHTTLFVTITTTIATFQIFVVIYLLTGGGPYYATETLVFTIYRTAFTSYEFGKASAQGVILFIIIAIIALVQLRLLRSK